MKKVENESLDLTNCDREPIHLIGSIQEHGYFFAFRLSDKTVYHVSANVTRLLGKSISEVLGRKVDEIFGSEAARRVLGASQRVSADNREYLRLREIEKSEKIFEGMLYEFSGLIALELEEVSSILSEEEGGSLTSMKRNQTFFDGFQNVESLNSLAKNVCRAIREMTGFDRVMMYRYLPDWNGEVIAEDKSPEAHSFLFHRFPATDIPLPARTLYLRNRNRQIVDSHAGVSPIEPRDHYLTRKQIDLTDSKLRAVSAIHLAYLKNMDVRASFSVAVIVEEKLWGLIACHGRSPQLLPHEIRLSCEAIAATFAAMADLKESLEKKTANLDFEDQMREMFRDLKFSDAPVSLLLRKHALLEKLFNAQGVAVATRAHIEIAGLTPPQDEIASLADVLRGLFRRESKSILAIESLTSLGEHWRHLKELACGVLAVHSDDIGDMVLMLFRPEVLRTTVWGGDPRKTMDKRQYRGPINPRVSFESWTETVTDHSAKWAPYEIRGAAFLRDFVFDVLVRKEQLIQDLGHQLKFAETHDARK